MRRKVQVSARALSSVLALHVMDSAGSVDMTYGRNFFETEGHAHGLLAAQLLYWFCCDLLKYVWEPHCHELHMQAPCTTHVKLINEVVITSRAMHKFGCS